MPKVLVNSSDTPPGDAGASGPDEANGRLLAGKYKTQEDLQKGIIEALKLTHEGDLESAYKELESRIGSRKKKGEEEEPAGGDASATADSTTATTDTNTSSAADGEEDSARDDGADNTEDPKKGEPKDVDPSVDAASAALSARGLDITEFESEWIENMGQLSEDSYAKLEAAGFSRQLVSQFIDGRLAVAERFNTAVYNLAEGGEEGYKNMIEWAGKNLDKNEIAAYNDIVSSGSIPKIKFAIESLQSRYKSALGTVGRVPVSGTTTSAAGSGSVQAFQSWSEVTKAMGDPRYGTDPAYTKTVEARLKKSSF